MTLSPALYVVHVANDALQYLIPGSGDPVPVTLLSSPIIVGVGLASIGRLAGRIGPKDALFAALLFIPIGQFLVMGSARMAAF